MRYSQLGIAIAALLSVTGQLLAQDSVFELGKINVTAEPEESVAADDKVTQQELWDFDRPTLDQAVKLIPGVMTTLDSNGRRNEHDIFVRGFGRWQVPMSIDGIRVYLPADNRLDFNRFLTHDLAQIQVQKGYVSVLDGPGGMGGAINLVTRKPTRAFEAEFQSGASFGTGGGYDSWSGAALIGTRQENYYLQASGSYLDRDEWYLSNDFSPTAMEDGDARNGSDNRDWRVNVKAGWTPNDTDEYSLSYTTQSGRKGAPLNVYNSPPNPPNSYWRWPWWDVDNLYWLSSTQLGDSAYIRTRLFYAKFQNSLFAYDDATYTTQSLPGRFKSYYDDDGYGGSVEVGTTIASRNTLKAAVHYRRDRHSEYNYNRPTNPPLSTTEPKQKTREDTWSVALENTFQASDSVAVAAGVSYDRNELDLAQEYNTTQGLFEYPTGGSDAVNGQAAVHWSYDDAGELSASISSRSRFPTIFERFSTRFGTAVPNPDLDPERAVNYEIGWEGSLAGTELTAAVFYNDVKDMIQTVVVSAGPPQTTQTQNVGNGEFYGIELRVDSQISGQFRVGANYTCLKREITDALQPTFKPVGTPTNQAFAFLSYQPVEPLTITPSVEFADDRWSDRTGGGYVETGEYTLVNLQLQYRFGDTVDVSVGGQNLLDEDFQLAWGFPEPGRNYYMKLKMTF